MFEFLPNLRFYDFLLLTVERAATEPRLDAPLDFRKVDLDRDFECFASFPLILDSRARLAKFSFPVSDYDTEVSLGSG